MATQTTATDKFVSANSLRLHYLEWDQVATPTIVMLHGLRGSAQAWRGVAESLSDRYRILAVDQRGRGDSDWAPTGDYSRNAYVADLASLADQLCPDPFLLVGHSMGGANTFAYAATHPERVLAAVIEDMGPASNPPAPGGARIGRELDATPARFASWAEAERFTRELRPTADDAMIKQVAQSSLKELGDGQITWKYDLEGIKNARGGAGGTAVADLWPHVRNLQCPTLVLRGEKSDILAAETAQAMSEANPQIRWEQIPGATHFVHDDNLGAFNRAIADFLRAIGYP